MCCDVVWKSVLEWLEELVQYKHLRSGRTVLQSSLAEVAFSRSTVIMFGVGYKLVIWLCSILSENRSHALCIFSLKTNSLKQGRNPFS